MNLACPSFQPSGPKSGANRGRSLEALSAFSAAAPWRRGAAGPRRAGRGPAEGSRIGRQGIERGAAGASRRSGATPACAKARTTDAAQQADSSQLDGSAAVWIGTGCVDPRTRILVLVLGASQRARPLLEQDLARPAAPSPSIAERPVVVEQADDGAVPR